MIAQGRAATRHCGTPQPMRRAPAISGADAGVTRGDRHVASLLAMTLLSTSPSLRDTAADAASPGGLQGGRWGYPWRSPRRFAPRDDAAFYFAVIARSLGRRSNRYPSASGRGRVSGCCHVIASAAKQSLDAVFWWQSWRLLRCARNDGFFGTANKTGPVRGPHCNTAGWRIRRPGAGWPAGPSARRPWASPARTSPGSHRSVPGSRGPRRCRSRARTR